MNEIKRGEIYYFDFSPVVGSEQGGIRPAVILQNDTGNKYSPTTIVAAITSKKTKSQIPTHVQINVESLKEKSTVLLEHIKTVDKSRLMEYVAVVDEQTMKEIDWAIGISFGLKYLEVLRSE